MKMGGLSELSVHPRRLELSCINDVGRIFPLIFWLYKASYNYIGK
jgi:hypothetical protein